MEIKGDKLASILKEKGWNFRECPFCGNRDIGAEYQSRGMNSGKDVPCTMTAKVWGYCRYCGAKGRTAMVEVIGEDELVAAAVEKWNYRTA